MNRSTLACLVRWGLAASCLVVSPPVAAVVVGTQTMDTDPEGNNVNALMNGFRFFADGLSARYIDRANQGIAPATVSSWRAFEQRMRGSTFVTLFYEYQGSDGVSRSRTYYAMSGSRGSVASGPEPLLTPDLPEWLDPWPGEVMATAQDDANTRVPWQLPTTRPEATWDLQDAEMKAARTLEKDLRDHVVEPGGVATVFISGVMCLACSQALYNFANAYPVSVVAKEIAGDGPQTSELFRARREAYLATVRSSLIGRERFRPAHAPPVRGMAPLMCVAGRPVVTYPLAVRPTNRSALVALIRAYARQDGDASYVLDGSGDEAYAGWELVDPASPYSPLAARELSPVTRAERVAGELIAFDGYVPGQYELHARKQRELGFTRSRPWTDVRDGYGPPINGVRGVPSHAKANVDSDILIAVRDKVGRDYPAIAALYAVAAQLLREKARGTPVAEQRRTGLRVEVLDGIEATPQRWRPTAFDLQYLAVLLDGGMREWDIGPSEEAARPLLPLPLRLARMAAAYRDQQPFDVDPCLNPREHNPATAGTGGTDPRPLCFNDATDRAVYAWFVAELRHETARGRALEFGDSDIDRLIAPFHYTQFGSHDLGVASLETAMRKEVVEMKIVNRLVADGDLSYEASLPVIHRAVTLLQPKRN